MVHKREQTTLNAMFVANGSIANVVYQSMQMNAETARLNNLKAASVVSANNFYELDLVEMELHQVRMQMRQQLVSMKRHLRVSEEPLLWND